MAEARGVVGPEGVAWVAGEFCSAGGLGLGIGFFFLFFDEMSVGGTYSFGAARPIVGQELDRERGRRRSWLYSWWLW